MAELFKFRCSECHKPLGVPPRKVGRPIRCPRCGAELIVPDPSDPGDPADGPDDAAEAFDLGIDLGFAAPLDLRPEGAAGLAPLADRAAPDPDALAAIAFLQTAAASPAAPPPATAELDPVLDEDDDDDPEPIVRPAAEPIAPRSGRPASRSQAAAARRRDVVLPRTAAIAWSLFALLALALSFVAGLMIGHYRWK